MIYYFKRYWKLISLLIVVLITLIISLINYYFGKEKKEDVTIVKENFTEKKENNNLNDIKTVFVDVKGAVNQPGVYEIDEERRIIDQTCTIMIQKLTLLFARNPLNIKGI